MYNLTEEEKQKIHTALICASDSGTLDEFTKEELSLINEAESIVNKLTIPNVSQKRELFNAILDFSEELPMCTEDYHRSELWEKYKAFNCG
jgi:hypothetical protein